MTQDEVVGRVVDALIELGIPYMVAGSFASNLIELFGRARQGEPFHGGRS